jgi:hypothetical protein
VPSDLQPEQVDLATAAKILADKEGRPLGLHPETGLEVYVKFGNSWYYQHGHLTYSAGVREADVGSFVPTLEHAIMRLDMGARKKRGPSHLCSTCLHVLPTVCMCCQRCQSIAARQTWRSHVHDQPFSTSNWFWKYTCIH